jgi:hypothetical protein
MAAAPRRFFSLEKTNIRKNRKRHPIDNRRSSPLSRGNCLGTMSLRDDFISELPPAVVRKAGLITQSGER